jgi:hypothetical protein
MINELIRPIGNVEGIIEFDDGSKEIITFKNTILKTGRIALANSIGNNLGANYSYYVNSMIWGSNGTSNGSPLFVNAERTGLFGTTTLSKPVISTVDNTQVIFTSVVLFSDGALLLNEMALVMANGSLYSMVTFPDLNKTPSMQLTWNWRLQFI